MENSHPAAFRFNRYSISSFSFKNAEDKYTILNVNFDPSGIFNKESCEFKLTIKFKAVAATENEPKEYTDVAECQIESYFQFEQATTEVVIPDFFYANSIAIVFPYIRAFWSTVTLQANLTIMMLPTLNLTHLGESLKVNTTFID